MLGSNAGLTWGVGPAISWSFPNMAGPLARLAQANAGAAAALSNFNSVVLQALKETEQALATYSAELDHHAALMAAQSDAQRAFGLAQDQYNAGLISSLDLLTSEETLVDADAAVASSDTAWFRTRSPCSRHSAAAGKCPLWRRNRPEPLSYRAR